MTYLRKLVYTILISLFLLVLAYIYKAYIISVFLLIIFITSFVLFKIELGEELIIYRLYLNNNEMSKDELFKKINYAQKALKRMQVKKKILIEDDRVYLTVKNYKSSFLGRRIG